MSTSVISVLDIHKIFFLSVWEETLIHILFLKVEIRSSIARFEVLRPMFMNSDVLVATPNHSNVLSEYIQTSRLLQTLCTDPAAVNHTLTKLRQLCYILEVMKRLNYCVMQLCTA